MMMVVMMMMIMMRMKIALVPILRQLLKTPLVIGLELCHRLRRQSSNGCRPLARDSWPPLPHRTNPTCHSIISGSDAVVLLQEATQLAIAQVLILRQLRATPLVIDLELRHRLRRQMCPGRRPLHDDSRIMSGRAPDEIRYSARQLGA